MTVMRSAVVIALLGLAPIGVAEAHIHLLQPMARQTTTQGDPQKEMHCGSSTLTRTAARTSTYLPGATVTVMWAETINHPGWFRIAFQPAGEGFALPIAGAGADRFPDVDATGTTDAAGALILKDRIADGTLQTEITLPNMECATCTLQFIQVMTNNPPYDIDQGAANNDLYFNCADITLAANAPDAGMQVGSGEDAGVDPGGGGPNSGTESGGCTTGSGAGLPAGLALLGLVSLRRRRRRS
jgi:MYXO-CTERM domain-containing protein